ncbi:MAG: SH3 domain-containing protein [Burkholderiales bacterium]
MKHWKWMGLVLIAGSLGTQVLAQEPGTAVKQDDIKAEPFKDAATLGAMKKGETVSILKKQGGWMQIKAAQGSGWVRVLSVRKGTGGGSAASEIAGVAGVATGRAGTGQVVSTTGVRGLGEEDLKGAKFNEEELKKAEAAAITAEAAKQFAAQADLVARSVVWLPEPKSAGGGGR